jgi:uncharacterized membrane protein affecting hemolysin expression
MILFVLSLHVCFATNICEWVKQGSFISEEQCEELGQALIHHNQTNMSVNGFRCVVEIRRTEPLNKDQTRYQ